MKKLLLILITLLVLCGCGQEGDIDTSDCNDDKGCEIVIPSEKIEEITLGFKDSYEVLNGKKNSKGTEYREVIIPENDIFKLVKLEDVEKFSDFSNLFTGIVFLSDPKCPWCRSIITEAVNVAKELEIKDVYVIHAWDEEGNELFRDKYVWEGNTLKLQEGHPLYMKLINLPGSEVFKDYTIKDTSGENNIILGEKRLLLPSFIYIKNGEVKAFTTGLSDLQKDANEELTDKIVADMKVNLTNFFKATKE